jgi:hypothetical protein
VKHARKDLWYGVVTGSLYLPLRTSVTRIATYLLVSKRELDGNCVELTVILRVERVSVRASAGTKSVMFLTRPKISSIVSLTPAVTMPLRAGLPELRREQARR